MRPSSSPKSWREVRMHLDQSGHHDVAARIDDAAGVQVGAMLDDLLDAVVANDDVDVGAQATRCLPSNMRPACTTVRPCGMLGCHVRLTGTSVTRLSVTSTSFRPRGGLIQQPLRVRGPRRRVGEIVRDGRGAPVDVTRRRRRHDVHHAVHHERHLRAVARPHRPIVGRACRSNDARRDSAVDGAPPVVDTSSNWLVPSRNRVEYGCSVVTAIKPSGAHVGRPDLERRP